MECSLYAPRFPCRKITTVMATPEKQTLRDFDELPVGGVDEFGTIPDIDTNVFPHLTWNSGCLPRRPLRRCSRIWLLR